MNPSIPYNLSRRERQIMDIVYRHGRVSAAEIQTELPDPPSYSAVRALLSILVERGQLRIESEGARYIYLPVQPRETAGRSAIQNVLQTFFGGSLEQAVEALLDGKKDQVTTEEAERIKQLIEQARKEKR